jgi:PAS domain-containing protein
MPAATIGLTTTNPGKRRLSYVRAGGNQSGNIGRPAESEPQRTGLIAWLSEVLHFGDGHFRELVEALPAALFTTDGASRLTFYNEAAAALWGARPELGESWCCGSWKQY